jgi:hypothetical protein
MGKTLLYLFLAIMASACMASLVMIFGPILYVEIAQPKRVEPSDIRLAAYFSLSIFILALGVIGFSIPRSVLSRVKCGLLFVLLPCLAALVLPALGVSYRGVMLALALLAIPAVYQAIVSRSKGALG